MDEGGQPLFNLGNIAIHMINRSFVEKLSINSKDRPSYLPYHQAHKKVLFWIRDKPKCLTNRMQ